MGVDMVEMSSRDILVLLVVSFMYGKHVFPLFNVLFYGS